MSKKYIFKSNFFFKNISSIKVGYVLKIVYFNQIKNNIEYNIETKIGICLAIFKKNKNVSVLIRNFYKIDAIESIFNLTAPQILSVQVLNFNRNFFYSKLYFLRLRKRKFYNLF